MLSFCKKCHRQLRTPFNKKSKILGMIKITCSTCGFTNQFGKRVERKEEAVETPKPIETPPEPVAPPIERPKADQPPVQIEPNQSDIQKMQFDEHHRRIREMENLRAETDTCESEKPIPQATNSDNGLVRSLDFERNKRAREYQRKLEDERRLKDKEERAKLREERRRIAALEKQQRAEEQPVVQEVDSSTLMDFNTSDLQSLADAPIKITDEGHTDE